ncbi:hypothetical protein K435DRAFT_809939 [Dendrothele bispora CBS 962.96]|uniref:Cyanovirin-N domain-containing protein n=1 Tax=Dendrothele bispora (strain CBS 962.96) TaxID=1314807 RepID=A0A4S8KWV4_DENBC|nr:hypothetical protein K435DRAFT_809939 [Dendrothele bispora CBS 962.96]
MPFDISNCKLDLKDQRFLEVEWKNDNGQILRQKLDLDRVLGVTNNEFKWGGSDLSKSARNFSVSGTTLRCEMDGTDGAQVEQEVDLAARIQCDETGTLEVFDTWVLVIDGSPLHRQEYEEQSYSSYSTWSTQAEWSSSYYLTSNLPQDQLKLENSLLIAEYKMPDEPPITSRLELNDHVGVMGHNLVWGRSGFFSVCKNVTLDGHTLKAEFRHSGTNDVPASSSLDLARYIQVYDGRLELKVTESSDELSRIFSEVPWMRFRVVTVPLDASVMVQRPSFKAAFSSLASRTSKHVEVEMKHTLAAEDSESIIQDIQTSTKEEVKKEMTSFVERQVGEVQKKIDTAFAEAKQTIVTEYRETLETAMEEITTRCIGSFKSRMTNHLVSNTVKKVSDAAIGKFQERVEILIENEVISADLRRAQTEAAFLEFMETKN